MIFERLDFARLRKISFKIVLPPLEKVGKRALIPTIFVLHYDDIMKQPAKF